MKNKIIKFFLLSSLILSFGKANNIENINIENVDPNLVYQLTLQKQMQTENVKLEQDKLKLEQDRLNYTKKTSDPSTITLSDKKLLYVIGGIIILSSVGLRKITWVSDKYFKTTDWIGEKALNGWEHTKHGGKKIKEFFVGKDYSENNPEVKEFFDGLEKCFKKIKKNKNATDTLKRPSHIEIGTNTEVHRFYFDNEFGNNSIERSQLLNQKIISRFNKEDLQELGAFKVNILNGKIKYPKECNETARDNIKVIKK
ncbi:MAG: hypothetical protein SZ59_C0002G0228 [candidate division TM6 bacterium GW2011_GWF2_28_16]|nr:MAG: hypothetical protein SZ59_C0002G0228 [candidate division TM6 bacterium GW2011_GWF2_28_16]